MTLKRMDNVLIVVDDLEAVKAFFIELGLKDVRSTIAMMRAPDGQGIELDKFHTPDAIRFGPVDAPVNALGIRRISSPSKTSTLSSRACAPTGPSS